MSMALSIDGLASGLDTTSLINSLMQLEAAPQTLLKRKVSATNGMIAALKSLNTKIAALGTLAKDTAKPAALDLLRTTSSSDRVTATAGRSAAAGETSIVVDQLSARQISLSERIGAWPDTALTITVGSADPVTVTAASDSLDDIVSAVNKANAGVSAMKVAAGTDAVTGDPLFRVQFTATEPGTAGAFSIGGTAATVTDIVSAQDAQLKLWAGTAAEQVITSSSNTFTGLLPGVDVTVGEASATPVTITVQRDDAAIGEATGKFVGSIAAALAEIAARSAVTSTTGSNGKPVVGSGPFTGDSGIRAVNQWLVSAATLPVDGLSPSTIGISLTKEGVLEFDEERFAAALEKDPARTTNIVQQLAARVADAADQASDRFDGLLTTKITGQESLVGQLSNQIDNWDTRLATRRATLERTYAALEVQLSTMNAQSAWLASQVNSLPKMKSAS